jgi:acetolactate synthase small subunit
MPTFVVDARKTPEMLARVVLLFHRLAVEIDGLTFQRRKDDGGFCITIQITGHSDKSRRIEANLYKIVDVLSVETIPDDARNRVDSCGQETK